MRKEPWDYPPEPDRFERVEILPPRQPRQHIEVTFRKRHEIPQHWIIIAALVVFALIAFRMPGGLLILAAIVGPANIGMAIVGNVAIVVLAALREKRSGRPF